MKSKAVEKLREFTKGRVSELVQDASRYAENQSWMDQSAAISMAVLSELRSRGISQIQLAQMMNVSPPYIHKILRGNENLTLETIGKIEGALGISLVHIRKKNGEKREWKILAQCELTHTIVSTEAVEAPFRSVNNYVSREADNSVSHVSEPSSYSGVFPESSVTMTDATQSIVGADAVIASHDRAFTFMLRSIRTIQFRVHPEHCATGCGADISTTIALGINAALKEAAVKVRCVLGSKGDICAELSTECVFGLSDTQWADMTRDETLVVPADLVQHIVSISMGITRGVFHAETEGTVLSDVVLPLFDISKTFNDAVHVNLAEA